MGRALSIVVLGDPAALEGKVTRCTGGHSSSSCESRGPNVHPHPFPNMSMWSSYLETS